MHHQTTISRRFFAAFYRWSALNAGCRHQRPIWSQICHASTSADAKSSSDSTPPPTDNNLRIRYHMGDHQASLGGRPREEIGSWENAPIRDSEEYPLDRIPMWCAAVRHRSGEQVELEYALPRDIIPSLRRKHTVYWSHFTGPSKRLVELGRVRKDDNAIQLLFTGRSADARRLDIILSQYRAEMMWVSPLETKATADFRTAEEVSAQARLWINTIEFRTPRELPSARLAPWSYVRRQRFENRITTVEVSIPETLFQRHQKRIADRMEKLGVKLETEAVGLTGPSQEALCTCCMIGRQHELFLAHESLEALRLQSLSTQRGRIPQDIRNALMNKKEMIQEICSGIGEGTTAYLETDNDGSGETIMVIESPESQEQQSAKMFDNFFSDVIRQRNSSIAESGDYESLTQSDKLKNLLRPMLNPVAVITTSDPGSNLETGINDFRDCRGVTVSSFNTVTLEPEPIVSFNLRLPSRSWDAMQGSERLCIHILASNNAGAHLAQGFTRPYDEPADPFRQLEARGANIFRPHTPEDKTPTIQLREAVLGTMQAEILKDKCVHVNDHVIVLAKVLQSTIAAEHLLDIGKSFGLAYSHGRYRGTGSPINANILTSGSERGQAAQLSPITPKDSEKRVIFFSKAQSDNDAHNAASEEAVDEPEFDDVDMQPGGEVPAPMAAKSARPNQAPDYPVSQRYDSSHQSQHRPSYSPLSASHTQTRRSYSTKIAPSDESHSSEEVSSSIDPKTTVADFLSLSGDKFDRPRSVKRLYHAKKRVAVASTRLRTLINRDQLTSDGEAYLRGIISSNEREVARTLALRAAADLGSMLDRGRVDVDRAQWLESAIEKGQALILDEARRVRQSAQEGNLNQNQFLNAKQKLESEFDILKTEAMRLRAMADDDTNDD